MNFVFLIALAAAWGVTFIFVRVAVADFSPIPLIFIRLTLAGLLLLPWVLPTGGIQFWRKKWRPIFGVSLFLMAVPFCLMAWASVVLSASMMSVLNATTPIMAALWAGILFKTRLTRLQTIGLSLGLLGVFVLASGQEQNLNATDIGLRTFAVLCATGCYGWSTHMSRVWLSDVPPVTLTCTSLLSSAVCLAPFAAWLWPQKPISPYAWSMAIGLAVISTAFAYAVFYHLNTVWGTTRTLTVTYLAPLFGMFSGVLLLGEKLTSQMLLGGVIIFSGVAMLTLRKRV